MPPHAKLRTRTYVTGSHELVATCYRGFTSPCGVIAPDGLQQHVLPCTLASSPAHAYASSAQVQRLNCSSRPTPTHASVPLCVHIWSDKFNSPVDATDNLVCPTTPLMLLRSYCITPVLATRRRLATLLPWTAASTLPLMSPPIAPPQQPSAALHAPPPLSSTHTQLQRQHQQCA